LLDSLLQESKMSCCPPGAYGDLTIEGYTPKGVVETVGDLDMYRVGSGEKCIIWNYDIFGLNAGRTKMLADLFSESGYLVIIPDYYRNGEGRDPANATDVVDFIKTRTNWTKLQADWKEKILPYAQKHGAKSFGAVGTCWGSYMVVRFSSLPEFKAGVSFHPSHTPISGLLGEDVKETISAVCCPQLFMPAGGDAKEDMANGQSKQILGDKLKVIECLEMKHGWVTRGNMEDTNTNRDVLLAIKEGLDFFKNNL